MKIRVGNRIIDPGDEPIVMIFQDDIERGKVADQIQSMAPRSGARVYAQFPEGFELPDGYMEESVKLSGYVG